MFDQKQLTGKQVSWEGVREALAVLRRPSTMKEVAEAMWRLFNIYCTRIGITTVRKLHNFEMMVESMINSNLEKGKLLSVKVGGKEFVWLEEEEWPDKREQERMENYRTVNQAVRVVMEDIVSSGERFRGVFAQVKRIHQFVETNTNYTKKQVRYCSSINVCEISGSV